MREDEPPDGGGLPDAGGLNIDYAEPVPFEPTEDQLDLIQADLEAVADRVRPHLISGFTVTTRLARTREGPQGVVVVSFPTGEAIGPGIRLTADMFESIDDPEWTGPISPEEIETMSRQITTLAVTQWAKMSGDEGGDAPAQ